MAIAHERVHRMNNEGTYDIVHYETDSDMVIMGDDNTLETKFNSLVNSTDNHLTEIDNNITALRAAVGSPLTASTKASMTDTNKVYVYTGNESDMINGNWYYYYNNTWTSGGVYNESALETDTTLTVSGYAADSKAVGDEFNNLKNEIGHLDESVNKGVATYNTFVQGRRVNADPWIVQDRTDRCTTNTTISAKAGDILIVSDITPGYKYAILNAEENYDSGWLTNPARYYAPTTDTTSMSITVAASDGTSNVSPEDFTIKVELYSNVWNLKKNINALYDVQNYEHFFINYGYDSPFFARPNPSSTDSAALGIERNGPVITLNGGGISRAIAIKIDGLVQRTITDATVKDWEATLFLKANNLYEFSAKLLSGSLSIDSVEKLPSLSVYRSGEANTVGNAVADESTRTFTRFVYGNDSYVKVCLRVPAYEVCNNAKILVLCRNVTEETTGSDIYKRLKDTNNRVDMFYNIVNYGYDRSGLLVANPTATASSTVVGIMRDGMYVTLDGTAKISNSDDPIRIKIDNTLTREYLSGRVANWTPTFLLKEGHEYEFSVVYLSGSITYADESLAYVSLSLYKSGKTATIGFEYYDSETKTYKRTVTGDGELVSVALYLRSGLVLDKARLLVLCRDITDDGEIYKRFKDTNDRVDILHNIVNYGYDKSAHLVANPTATASATVVGVDRDGMYVTVNGIAKVSNSNNAIKVKLNDGVSRSYTAAQVQAWEPTFLLEEGHIYEFSTKLLSGTIVDQDGEDTYASISLYTAGTSSTIGEGSYDRYRKVYTRTIVGTGELVNVVLYLGYGFVFTDARILVMCKDITYENSSEAVSVAPYYLQELNDTVNKVRNINDSPALVFPWATDIHRFSSNAGGVQTFEKMIRNMTVFSNYVKCDFVLFTGDLTDGNVARDTTLSRAYDCLDKFRSIGVPFVWSQGNHDNNPYNGDGNIFTIQECYKAYFTSSKGHVNISENGTDYYIDFDELNTRLIVLNANNVKDYTKYAFGATTVAWLTSVLDVNKKTILAIHQTPYTSHTYSDATETHRAPSMKAAVNNFVNQGGNIVVISGHSHLDITFVDPWIEVMQDCQRFCPDVTEDMIDPEVSPSAPYVDVCRKNAREANTASEDLWTACVYKPFSNDFYLIRFGAGIDRYLHCTPIGAGTVTTILDGTVTWSTSDSEVATVSDGEIEIVGTGTCAVIAKDEGGNIEVWIVKSE